MNSFFKGLIAGAGAVLLVAVVVLVFRFFYERDRKIYEYMEAQHEIQAMREDINNRPPDEFLEDPGVRGRTRSPVRGGGRQRRSGIQTKAGRGGTAN